MARRKIAWVTGGGRGIGRACAVALAEQSCDVAVSARTQPELHETAQACSRLKARAFVAPCDVTDAAAVDAAHKRIASQMGAPDILVNAAGLARSMPFLKTTAEFMDSLWRLNVMGTFHCTQAALPAMVENGWGRIVNIASVSGLEGAPYVAAYAASKHAVVGLTRSLAAEFGGKGVRVNAVCPGYVDTQLTRQNIDIIAKATGLTREEALSRVEKMNEHGRLIRPEEVADVVAGLATGATGEGANGMAILVPPRMEGSD